MSIEKLKFEDQITLEKNDQKEEEFFREIEIQIENNSRHIRFGKIVSSVMFLLFLIILTVNISVKNGRNWYYVLAPAILTVIFITILVNYYLNIQNILDNLESSEVNIGTLISYFCLNIVSINLIIYLVLLCLKMEGIINSSLSIIAIPIYIIFGVCFFYFIFILPALIQTKMYFEILLIISYVINLFIFLIVINSKYDSNSNALLSNLLIPLWIALSFHIAYMTYNVIINDEQIVNYISSFLILGIIITVTILICCKNDYNVQIDNWIFGVLVILAYHFFLIEKIYQFYWKVDQEIIGKDEIKK